MSHHQIIVIKKCKGQAKDGSQVCADRDVCFRYTKPDSERQEYENYWMAGDRCANSLSIPKELA